MTRSGPQPFRDSRELLQAELDWLDDALRHLVRGLARSDGEDGGHGWFVSAREAEELLGARRAGHAAGDGSLDRLRAARRQILSRRAAGEAARVPLAQPRLAAMFGLVPAEELLLVACLAPELDARYGRVYGYLHDDLTRRQPSLQLIASLARLDESFGDVERLLFDHNVPVFRWHLVGLHGDGGHRAGQGLALDPRIAAFVMGMSQPDGRIAPFLRRIPPLEHDALDAPEQNELVRRLEALVGADGRRLFVCFHGRGAGEGRRLAQKVCRGLGAGLLHADLEAVLHAVQTGGIAFGEALRRIYREALLQGDGVYLSRFDRLLEVPHAPTLLHDLEEVLHEASWFTCVEGSRAGWMPGNRDLVLLQVAMPSPSYRERQACWRRALGASGAAVADEAVSALAARYRLTAGEIAEAVRLAADEVRAQSRARPDEADLRRACKHYAISNLDGLARRVRPRATWDDLVVRQDVRTQLEEICAQVRQRAKVLHDWGFDRRLSLGKGLYALFTGPSGTGKTLAAEVIARSLDFDLLKIDLSAVVSKYIGETEKNLQRVFDGADRADCILFFDEADALFGKRSEIKDAHDRYANIEVNFLLQRLDEYEGVVILASNLAQNIDEAFARRLHFTVEFPFPDEQLRLAIWRSHFTAEAPVEDDLDLAYFAREFKISGASIRKIVLNAAFLAADEGDRIAASHLLRATRREYERMGKPYLVKDVPDPCGEVRA